jgi:hypothetical protein
MPRSRKASGTARASQRASNNGFSHADLVRLAKKGMGHSAAARELDVKVSSISSMAWSHALVEAGRYSQVPATTPQVKKLYDNEKNRWELIAARTGSTVAHVKELYGGGNGSASVGRGPGRSKTDGATPAKGRRAKASGTVKTASAKTGSGRGRSRTRAAMRAARSSNPS